MNDYEKDREARIARNKAALSALTAGLLLTPPPPAYRGGGAGDSDSAIDHEAAAARRRQREEEREQALVLARRSLRARGMAPVTESGTEMGLRIQWAEEARVEAGKRRALREQLMAEARERGEVMTRAGRPITWIGGGGQDASKLARMGVPELRALFREIFGQVTASNNSAWLRKKLAEPPAEDAEGGARRAAQPRSRDVAASIWTGEGSAPRELMRPPRADPCLLEAQQFITRGARAPPPPPPLAALPTPSAAEPLSWGAKRPRSALARAPVDPRAAPPLAPSQPAAAASPLLLQRIDSMSKGTQQLDSAPTSDNEKPSSATALLGGAVGSGAFCLSAQDDPLLQFPWGESGVVPAVW